VQLVVVLVLVTKIITATNSLYSTATSSTFVVRDYSTSGVAVCYCSTSQYHVMTAIAYQVQYSRLLHITLISKY
jgi:ABC-type taurine transport system substrate-binding protein